MPVKKLRAGCTRYFAAVSTVFLAVACVSPVHAQQSAAKLTFERITAEGQHTTRAGATFLVPAGWSIATAGDETVLEAPEPDTHLAIVDVSKPDATAAVAAAWTIYKPESKRPLRIATPQPARNGWDEQHRFTYETSPNERAAVVALAYRSGDRWTVVIADGTEATFEKRAAQAQLIVQSLRPKGYQRENFAGRKALSLNPERVAILRSFVEDSMKKLGVPGASMALVDGGKVVYEGGIGVKELGKPDPVDANTLFIAASNTKGMTTLLLARLADQKKLRWDQPVTELYPAFKLGDANTTKQVLVKHLICACTGLPRQDLEWLLEFKDATPASSLALLGTMQPTSKFGEVFQYSNLMASAAGYIGGHLYEPDRDLGTAYDDAMQKMIFDPLGMTSTTFSMDRALKANHASPHGGDVDGRPSVSSMALNYAIVPQRPAGGAWTSAHDLIRYVQLELAKGKLPNGERLVTEENILERRRPQISTGDNKSYGMGLSIDRTWGVTVIDHGGSMAGFKSDLMFLPDYNIGAVLLTNSDTGGMLLRPFMRRLLEVVFDGKPEAVADVDATAANYKANVKKDRERLVVPAAPDEVAKLAARYTSPALGELVVKRADDRTVFDFGEWSSSVATRKNDDGTISFITIDPSSGGFEFVAGERAGKKILIIRDGQHEYVFTAA